MPNKDSTVAGSWALRAQVIHDRLTRLLGQWKNVAATQFTHREMDGSFFPVHVVQLQLDNLGCAQAKVGETANHRISTLG